MSPGIAKIHDNKIAVMPTCDSVLTKAKDLAAKLYLPLIKQDHINQCFSFLLAVTLDRLELRETKTKHTKPIFVDFLAPSINYRIKYGGGKKQLIARAIGIKNQQGLSVIDATAGLGIDAFVLASLGCEVMMLERSPIISVLLEDGLERLKKNSQINNYKINLHTTQSIDYINKVLQGRFKKPDIIYLDPMYPKRTNSALNKKTMGVLHELVGDDNDAPQMLGAALKCAKNRVIIKRPRHADYLGKLEPNLQLSSGGSSRYDIYFIKKKQKEKYALTHN
ncbi:MAG: class I SAM-dependent methyltransferase [Coxiellaceae bacterium]|jgi:16S rRNA (guanine1516-N2)-methyltransferase|nr:class I SAM-dependent methyltransferase [Coxiellaceae bacterium]